MKFWVLFQEFQGVVGLNDSTDLESDMTKAPTRTVEILAACHALVYVDNKLVRLCHFLVEFVLQCLIH